MKYIACYLCGLLFGTGILISGMANPAKVLNFFDIFGTWDPSLVFVMGGALATTIIGYRIVWKRQAPFLSSGFNIPEKKAIDLQLIGGAGLFGIGWGIAGYCPGAALPVLGTATPEGVIFVAALIAGIIFAKVFLRIWGNGAGDLRHKVS